MSTIIHKGSTTEAMQYVLLERGNTEHSIDMPVTVSRDEARLIAQRLMRLERDLATHRHTIEGIANSITAHNDRMEFMNR